MAGYAMNSGRTWGAARLVARAEVRRRRVGLAVLALAVALAFGFVLTAAAGARRTAGSFDRFRRDTRGADILFQLERGTPPADMLGRLQAAPGIAAVAGFLYLPIAPDRPGVEPTVNAGGFGAIGTGFGTDIYRYRVLEGRRADPRSETEFTVNRELARLAHLHVGDRVDLVGVEDSMRTRGTVVGIHLGEFDLSANAANPSALFTPAFTERWLPVMQEKFGAFLLPAYLARLTDPSPAAAGRVESWARTELGAGAVIADADSLANQTQDGVSVQATSMVILAAVAAIGAIVALAQAANRVVAGAAGDVEVLQALGMTRRHRAAVLAAPVAIAVVLGAGLAVGLATIASVTMPVGFAGRIETRRGVDIDPPVLVAGVAALTVAVLGAVARSAWRRSTAATGAPLPRPIRLPTFRSVGATVGVRRALATGRPADRQQARATITAVAAAVAGCVAVASFVTSEGHLLASPRTHGWSFDVAVLGGGEGDGQSDLLATAAASHSVAAYGSIATTRLLVGDVDVDAFRFVSERGDIHPTMIQGNAPVGGDDIVLGRPLAQQLHIRVGDRVRVRTEGASRSMRVTGLAAFPVLGDGDFGFSASLAAPAFSALAVEPSRAGVVAKLRPGATVDDVGFAPADDAEIIEPFLPPQLVNLERAGGLPTVLAAFLAAVGTAAVAHALVTTVRRSRRELGVLRCLGFVRRDAALTVAWQASTYVAVAVLLGVPLGVLVGRLAWGAVATDLGVANVAVLPLLSLAGVPFAALIAANVAAMVPAVAVARLRPADVLRAE